LCAALFDFIRHKHHHWSTWLSHWLHSDAASFLSLKMQNEVAAVKRSYDEQQAQIRSKELGGVVADLAEASKGAAVDAALDEAARAARREPDGSGVAKDALNRAETEIRAFAEEAVRQGEAVENARRTRQAAQAAIAEVTYHFKELEAAVHRGSALDTSAEIQTALRLAGSSLRYTTTRLSTGITAAWVMNGEADSEAEAVAEVKARVEALDEMVHQQEQKGSDKARDRKIAQSTLELALSKLEGLARTVTDSGVHKDPAVQKALEASEAAYLAAKKRFGYDEALDPRASEELVQLIKSAEEVAQKSSSEQQVSAARVEAVQERVESLVAKLAAVTGMCDASGPLVAERVYELAQTARKSVRSAVRLLRREDSGAAALESAIEGASLDIALLEKTAATARDEVSVAESEYAAAREQLDSLAATVRAARAKADSYGSESVRGLGAILGDAEGAVKLCRGQLLGVAAWLADPAAIKALVADAALKVEMAEDEVERDVAVSQAAQHEADLLAGKQQQLQARHDKVCKSLRTLKTSPPPSLTAAIAATDKAMADGLRNKGRNTGAAISQLENLVKEEEDLLVIDVHSAERRLLDLEKAATQVPLFLAKLAELDAAVDAAGVFVASLVEVELGEAHRAVRALEHALDGDASSPSPQSMKEVEAAVNAAENAVGTQVRRVSNAAVAQQESKAQLSDVSMGFDELNDAVAGFAAQADLLHFNHEASSGPDSGGPSLASSLSASPQALSLRLIRHSVARAEQLLVHARRRVEAPLNVWVEYGPQVAQNALDSARDGVRTAKTVVDEAQAKLDANDLERQGARQKLEDGAQSVVSLRAQVDSLADSTDASVSSEAVDAADRAVDVTLRMLSNGTVASANAAMEVALRKCSEAETLVAAAIAREERVQSERKIIRDQFAKARSKLDASKEAATFLDLLDAPSVADALSFADRALIGVDLVLKCEFGLPMLRKEMQAATAAVTDFASVVEREKSRAEGAERAEAKKKHEERVRTQRLVELDRARAMEETMARRAMQDQLEAAIHQLQLHWPAVVDVQNSMAAAESSVEAARAKLAQGGLAAANAAVATALAKVQSLEATAKTIEDSTAASVQKTGDAFVDLSSDVSLLQKNLNEVNLRIEKQNRIMAVQSKLIMVSDCDSSLDKDALRQELNALLSE